MKKVIYNRNIGLISSALLLGVTSDKAIPSGEVTFKADVIYSGEEDFNKTISLYINGEKVGTKEIGSITNAGGNLLQAGRNFGTPVSPSYKSPYIFTGNLKKVTVDIL